MLGGVILSKRADYRARLTAMRQQRPQAEFDKPILLQERRICVASDVHIPKHDNEFLMGMLDRCEREGIEAIVWLGDLMDMEAMSSFGITDKTTSLRHDLHEVHEVIDVASQVVSKQYWTVGNHEHRWVRRNDHFAGMHELALMADLGRHLEKGWLEVSDNPTILAFENEKTEQATWMLTHPGEYAKVPLVTPNRLAVRFQMNVMAGHAHHFALGLDETGRFTTIETGGLFDPRLNRYIHERVTTHRSWVQGYWFLIDGEAFGFRPKHRDEKVA